MNSANYLDWAGEIGLDMALFNACLQSEETRATVLEDFNGAASLGVTATPTFFINGRFLSGAQPLTSFQRIIDDELKE